LINQYFFRKAKMPKIRAEKICLIRTSALGDAVHALALANGLRRGYPDAHITWILQPLPYEMVKYQKSIDRFVIFHRNKGFAAWKELNEQLKNERFDLAVIPQVSFRSSFITALVRADIKLGFDFNRSRELSWLFINRHIPPKKPVHVQDQFFEFLDYLGIENKNSRWDFAFTQNELDWQKTFFKNIGRPAIAFVIASSHPGKDWFPEGYAEVMDYIDRTLDFQPFIVGGPSPREHKIAGEILDHCKSRPIIALEKPIRNTLLQLAGSAIVVSPDTGPLHAAVALNVPTIGLYGYSDPRRCGPYKKFHDLLIDKYNDPGDDDSPITRKTCKNGMHRISAREVITKINLGLEKYVKP
jgi:heptosyltransferase I